MFRKLYRSGSIDNRKIQLDIPDGRVRVPVDITSSGGGFAVNELIYRVSLDGIVSHYCPLSSL